MESIIVLAWRTPCWAYIGTHKGYRHSDDLLSKSTVLLSSCCKLHCSVAPHFSIIYNDFTIVCWGRDIIASHWIMDEGLEGTIKTQHPKCRLYWCLMKFIDWRYSQSCWYFRPLLWTVAPLPSLWPPPPPPLPKVNVQYTDSVWLWGGPWVVHIVDHILQEFNTLFLTRFRTYKIIATPPQTKTPVKTTFRDWCLFRSFIHALNKWPKIILM